MTASGRTFGKLSGRSFTLGGGFLFQFPGQLVPGTWQCLGLGGVPKIGCGGGLWGEGPMRRQNSQIVNHQYIFDEYIQKITPQVQEDKNDVLRYTLT